MLPSPTPPAPLHSLLFQLAEASLAVQPAMSSTEPQTTQAHLLLICTGGSGGLTFPGGTVDLSADRCFLLSPGTTYTAANPETTLYYYQLSFHVYQTAGDLKPYLQELLTGRQELLVHPFTRVIRLAEEITAYPEDCSEVQQYRQQLKFQELLLLLLEHNYHSDEAPSPAESVEGTLTYMQEHYMESITVKQLAGQAGVSLWQYTPLFQKLTGQKPLEYLTGLRISRSKQLLLESAEPLREIARLSGFSDEYYFSRRFRQITGVTPGQYAVAQRGKLTVQDWTGHTVEIPERPRRIVYHGETIGDLLALGVKPVGGDEEFARNSVYKHRLKRLANVGFPLNPQLTASLRPDLIIIANPDEKVYKRVAGIAPALTFDSFAPLEHRMRTLGGWLGKQREAEAWLAGFAARNAAMWQRLYSSGVLSTGETASALIFDHGKHLYAMGLSGLSSALYAPGGLRPTAEIQAVLDAELGFAEVDPQQLHAYAGDRVFMLIPEREDSRAAMDVLLESPAWRSLPAVQQGQAYLLDSSKWNFSDALTRERLLTLLPKVLGGHGTAQ